MTLFLFTQDLMHPQNTVVSSDLATANVVTAVGFFGFIGSERSKN
jgi:hypothetical protein